MTNHVEVRAPVHALVLAGSRQGEHDAVARGAGVSCKAFAPVAGDPMIERVLQALLDYPQVARIDVALPGQSPIADEAPRLSEWSEQGLIHLRVPAASPARTVMNALQQYPDGDPILVTTADHALLDQRMLDQFMHGCDTSTVDVLAAFVPLELIEAGYPNMKRTGLRFRDGRYSGCNLFLLRNGSGARSLVSFWQRLETLRKSPWRMALAVGPGALIGYGLRLLTLSQALDRIGRRAGARLAPVMLDIPEAAIDVDTSADLAFVEDLLSS